MAATVPAGYASWLKAASRTVGATIAGAAAAWGDTAADSSLLSPLANHDDAQAEAVAQAQFLAGPIAQDTVVVPGRRADLFGRVVAISGDRLGYETGKVVLVIGVVEAAATSTLTVVTRL